ncbi:MAG: SDR family oxidoreductase [Alphaproteobacteria bacterium]|nr:SDR family oxidoreductase [Alphaproteobacteria bacterium]
MIMPRIFIFGLGYSALALAGQLRSLGWEVAGTTRRESKIADLRQLGFTVYPFSRGEPLTVGSAALADFPYILNSVPPDDLGDPVFDLHSCDIVAQAPQLRWFGLLSTTGVYGDHQGAVVDETCPCHPTSTRAAMRLKVETQWLDLQKNCGLPLHVFRLAGIYGPGRNVLRDLQRGQAHQIVKPGHRFNRIHVADIVQALVASLHKPAPGNIYNIADDQPASSDEVVRYGAELLGIPAPPPLPYATAPLSPMAKIFYADNKIVGNAKAKQNLGLKLIYPTFREGLRALKS